MTKQKVHGLRVRDLVEKCTCPSQFPMVRVSEGKYRIGDTKVLIFVRILRSHVMVRVGGGWDTLSHYLDKHDPCRCRSQHRSSVAARLITRTNQATNGIELHKAQVFYERSPPSVRKTLSNTNGSTAASTPVSANGQNHNINNTSPVMGINNNNNNGNSNSNGANTVVGTLSPPLLSSMSNRNRSRSPTPKPVVSFKNVVGGTTHEHVQPLDKHSLISTQQSDRRSISPSPRRLGEFKKKQHSLDFNGTTVNGTINETETSTNDVKVPETNKTVTHSAATPMPNSPTSATAPTNGSTTTTGDVGKFENISDNGSEISDEGYRSLGLIQQGNSQAKRTSLHSQASVEDVKTEDVKAEDAKMNEMRPDQTSSDSQLTPSDDISSKETAELSESSPDIVDATPIEAEKTFEKAGVFVTDDLITINVSNTTGLRKTGFSDNLYGDEHSAKKAISKIPRSPMTRRRSIDSVNSDTPVTGLPLMSRKLPVYRSVRKPSPVNNETITVAANTTKDNNGTWSGRSANKKRSSLGTEILQPLNNGSNKGSFQRQSDVRSSQCMYDKNGRRIKSTSTSPTKQATSPLAQQILEAAESAKNDAHMLEKMKLLLSKYTVTTKRGTNGASPSRTKLSGNTSSPSRTASTASPSPSKQNSKEEYEDFTTAWVNSNGSLDRVSNCCSPVKSHSKRSSAASSVDSTHGKDVTITARRDRGMSRIPAPIRQNTELY